MGNNDQSRGRTVLMTADTTGEVWSWSLDLARALHPYRIDFVIATMGGPMNADQRAEAAACRNVRVVESSFRPEWTPDPWEDVQRAGEWLLDLQAKVRPDLIHLNGYVHASLPWKAPVAIMAHSCVLSWWEAVKGHSAPAEYDRYAHEVRAGLHAADFVAAPSQGMLASLEQHYGRLKNRSVIPDGRDPAMYRQRAKEPVIFSAGRLWDEAKNVNALQNVASELSWPVLVAGDDLRTDGSRRPMDSVCSLGPLSPKDLARWLSRAPIFALPARYEPFGLSVLEAALSGCALVLGNIPTLRENWDRAAVFVNPDDLDELRAALNVLIRSEELRQTLGERARERAVSFTTGRMAHGWLNAYSELTDRRQLMPCA